MRAPALLLLAFAIVGSCTGCLESSTTEGPLGASASATAPGISSTGGYVGHVYSTGLVTVTNPTGDSLVLDAVSLVGGQGGLRLVGAGIQRNANDLVGLDYGYPPRSRQPIAPLRGAVLAPHEGNVAVVVGARAVRPGADSFSWIRLDYHVASRRDHYRVDFPLGLQVCVLRPPAKHVNCPPPQLPGSK